MELIAPYRTDVQDKQRALQPVADSMGIPLDELWREIVAEWDQSGQMKASWLPRAFREGRMISELSFPDGWWIDITATETMGAIRSILATALPNDHPMLRTAASLTTAVLTGDDRSTTTLLATVLRETVQFDDGTLPLGIEFISKHGHPQGATGKCWAYWMREVDAGLDEPTNVTSSSAIAENDGDYNAALQICKIKSR